VLRMATPWVCEIDTVAESGLCKPFRNKCYVALTLGRKIAPDKVGHDGVERGERLPHETRPGYKPTIIRSLARRNALY
jgi:hypothetical protein